LTNVSTPHGMNTAYISPTATSQQLTPLTAHLPQPLSTTIRTVLTILQEFNLLTSN